MVVVVVVVVAVVVLVILLRAVSCYPVLTLLLSSADFIVLVLVISKC